MTNTGGTAAGWYHAPGDPENTQRYWDGAQWIGEPRQASEVAYSSSPIQTPQAGYSQAPAQPPFGSTTHDLDAPSGFLKALFDPSFKRLITPSVVKVYFIVGLVLIGLGAIVIFIGFAQGGGVSAVLGLVVVPLLAFIYVLGLRLFCEFLVVLFKIETNTRSNG